MGMPVESPPRMPPAWFVRVHTAPFFMQYGSLFSLPRRAAPAKPLPNSTPFTAGMANSACASRFSSPPNIGAPTPAGRPVTAHSTTPPTESPAAAAAAISARMAAPAAASSTGKLLHGRSGVRGSNARSGMLPICAIWAKISTPCAASSCRHRPPATHRGAVSRPEKCPLPEAACAP